MIEKELQLADFVDYSKALDYLLPDIFFAFEALPLVT